MRITCPNCSAQYEVDDALIPETGRDVQCSNCGKGWFQKPMKPEARPEEEEEDDDARLGSPEDDIEPAAVEDEPETEPEPVEEPEVAARYDEPEDEDEDDVPAAPPPRQAPSTPRPPLVDEDDLAASTPSGPEPDEDEDEDEEHGAETAPAPRKPDPEALSILREEAEFEVQKRRSEAAAPIETQPDLGLTEVAAAAGVGATVSETARRGQLLPDIDRINSTLRANADRDEDLGSPPDQGVQSRRRGFRLGFAVVILIVAILLLLYLYAPVFASAVPALEGFLIAYVDAANGLRDLIDGLLGSGVDSLS